MPRFFTSKMMVILVLLILFQSCKKEYVIYDSPEISIDGIKTVSLTKYKVYITVNKGEGQTITYAQIVLEDITVSNPEIAIEIELTEDRIKQYEIEIDNGLFAHDYNVKAVLSTDLYEYESTVHTIRSIKNAYELDLNDDELYTEPENNITVTRINGKGENFYFNLYYTENYVPQSIEIKLGNETKLSSYVNIDNPYFDSEGRIGVGGYATLPTNLSDGVYQVAVVVDGVEFVSEEKIRIIGGNWNIFSSDFPGEHRGKYAWFNLNNNLYVVGGSFYVTALDESPVWSFNLESKKWSQKQSFPHFWNLTEEDNSQNTEILPFSIQYLQKGYVLVRYGQQIFLYRYDEFADSWSFISEYPGKGDQSLTCFVVGNKLYLGGGLDTEFFQYGSTMLREFWAYNFITGNWEAMKDLPFDPVMGNSNSCVGEKTAFVLQPNQRFWQYDSTNDIWTERTIFPGSWRFNTKLVVIGDNVYVMGGEGIGLGGFYYYVKAYKDCWKYDSNNNDWSMTSLMPEYASNGIIFEYKNKIVTGLGYLTDEQYSSSSGPYTLFEYQPE